MDKKKLYELLGAKKFKKLVLYLEKFKFKVVEKLFPNNKLYRFFLKMLDKRKNKELEKAISEEQKKSIIENYKFKKLKIKRQYVNSRNDNYHLNSVNIDELKGYLNWNKKVHKIGLIKDIIFICATIPIVIFSSGAVSSIAAIILGWNIFSGAINFECINLQNYNLLRYDEKYDKLKRIEQRKTLRKVNKYKDANEIIAKKVQKSDDIPTINDIINSIKTEEQRKQLIKLIEEEQKKRNTYVDDSIVVNKEAKK